MKDKQPLLYNLSGLILQRSSNACKSFLNVATARPHLEYSLCRI